MSMSFRASAFSLTVMAFGLVLFFPVSGIAGEWLIKVLPVATVSGETVLLEDIAVPMEALPEESWERVRKTPLWDAPKEGSGPVSINKPDLERLLSRALGSSARACITPATLVLQRGGDVLTQERITRMTVEYLTKEAKGMDGEPDFRELRIPDSVFLSPAQEVHIELARPLQPGRNTFRLLVKDGYGTVVRRISGNVFMDLWKTVACAGRPLNRMEPVGLDEVTFVRKNLAYLRGEVWDGRSGPVRVKRPVGEGQVMYADNVEPIPLIQKGEQVTLLFKGQSIQLKVPALALGDGGAGEVIAVKNVQSSKTIQAMVLDSRTVVVN
ncbi:MAG: flagellar basal body P-ring formation chaperone FlgA [Desulfovibrionales bacterium]